MLGQKVNPLIYYSKIYSKYNNLWLISLNNYYLTTYFVYISYFLNYFKKFFFINNFNICFLNNKYYSQLNINFVLYIYNYLPNLHNYLKKIFIIKNIYVKQIKLNNLKINQNIYINFLILKNPFYSVNFIFYYIRKKFNQFKSFRKLLKQISLLLINIKHSSIKGVKILISGRINAASIAKTEICNYGLNSFNNYLFKIKYNNFYLKTKFGVLGFKIWLFLT